MLKEFGVTGLSEADKVELNKVWHGLQPWPDSVAGLTRLKQKYIIAPLSNGNISLIVNMAKAGGLPWDVVLGAEVARQYKPHPDAYLNSAKALDLPPDQCMLIAAHNEDLAAAQQQGFKTAFVARPTEHGSSQSADLEAKYEFNYIATDFNDLASQVGC